MSARSISPHPDALELPPEEHWTLHHILLHRIEREMRVDDATAVDPPPLEVFQAFEIIDAGETQFSVGQLEAIQAVLAEYHHSTTWWETERSTLEQLLYQIATVLKE